MQLTYYFLNRREGRRIFVFIAICVFGISSYLDIIPLRRWYHVFKARVYGNWTRLKIYMVSVAGEIIRYFET